MEEDRLVKDRKMAAVEIQVDVANKPVAKKRGKGARPAGKRARANKKKGDTMDEKTVEKLATSMDKLGDRLEKFQDPILWQKVFTDALRIGVVPAPTLLAAQQAAQALPAGAEQHAEELQVESVTVHLSDEACEKLAKDVFEALQPQLREFNDFVKVSLKEMPPGRLQALAEQIKKGKVTLKRRQGCVFAVVENGDEFYLGL